MRFILTTVAVLGLLGLGAAWWITRPDPLPEDALAGVTGDADRGEAVFWAAGCASCHAAPDGDDPLILAGGQAFPSEFGTFHAPNISMDPQHGIGDWSDLDMANAVMRGLSPSGAHYYPAFPYTGYARMQTQDMADLVAFLRTLPADATPSRDHDVGFPFNIRRAVGGWKTLYADPDWVLSDPETEQVERGRYLVEVLAHCGECHTPRNALGGMDRSQWLRGAPNPSGKGRIPGIAPDQLDWSAGEIAYYLESGFTPDYDSAGGSMAKVVSSFARLTAEDRESVAAYLKAL
ncbi:c-type cytochrome [Lacimonas salitolerans]|uniref:C-type cytochrome n=1 Tax=Lacimonas salitolerans TaxID=1323750 RepID=A0ABW4EF16_9RHOB